MSVSRTQNALLEETRSRLYRHPLNVPIADMADDLFFRELIERHPHHSTKFAAGVQYFFPAKNIGFSVAVFAKLKDGTVIECAFRNCIRQRCETHAERVRAAFRFEVRTSGKPKGFDAHHSGPNTFKIIYDLFWLTVGPPSGMDGVQLTRNDNWDELADRDLAAIWRRFHGERAQIEVIDRIEHQLRHKVVKP